MSKSEVKLSGIALILVVFVAAAIGGGVVTIANYLNQPKGRVGAFGSVLFLVTQNDTTATRAFNTSVRNTIQGSGQAMLVTVVANLKVSSVSTSKAAVVAFISAQATGQFCNCYTTSVRTHNTFTSGMYNNTGNYGIVSEYNATGGGQNMTVTLKFWVPWGFYYMVNDTHNTSPAPTIVGWLETIQPTGFGFIIASVIQAVRRPF